MLPKSFQKLINHFASLPSVGPKMAERLVLYLWKYDQEKLDDFAETLKELKSKIGFCKECFNISENDLCPICQDKKRDRSLICVVEEPLDVIAIEKTRQMRGLYHVLGGTINAPADKNNALKINELISRLKKNPVHPVRKSNNLQLNQTSSKYQVPGLSNGVKEVIIATNPTTEGEATALYLARLIRPLNIKITRLARGLPTGGDIEYADEATLTGSLEGRKEM
ncbi:recombination protein RecR [bacterium]|nr:MAG: recombination protein RecR [bacterium]